jgi:hypothetical protein
MGWPRVLPDESKRRKLFFILFADYRRRRAKFASGKRDSAARQTGSGSSEFRSLLFFVVTTLLPFPLNAIRDGIVTNHPGLSGATVV